MVFLLAVAAVAVGLIIVPSFSAAWCLLLLAGVALVLMDFLAAERRHREHRAPRS